MEPYSSEAFLLRGALNDGSPKSFETAVVSTTRCVCAGVAAEEGVQRKRQRYIGSSSDLRT